MSKRMSENFKRSFLLILLISCVGCSKGFSYNAYSEEKHFPRRAISEIQVLFDNPKQEYKTIGFINYDYYEAGWAPPTISDATPSIKEKVHGVGGDAVIIRSMTSIAELERHIRIVGDVIRFLP